MKLLKCLQSKENLRVGFYISKKNCRKIKNSYFDDFNIAYTYNIKIVEVVNWTEFNVMIVYHQLVNFETQYPHGAIKMRCRIKYNNRFENSSNNISYDFKDLYEISREKFEEIKTGYKARQIL